MDVTKLPRVGGRDNMLPRAGESALDQLRERVQGLEEEPAAATFDAEGEPVVEMDEGEGAAARPGWAIHDDTADRRVAVSTGDKKPRALRQTDAPGEASKHHKVVGDNEPHIGDLEGGEGWIACEVLGEAKTDQQLMTKHVGPENGAPASGTHSPLEWTCPVNLYFDAVGHCIGWVISPSEWISPWGVPDPR